MLAVRVIYNEGLEDIFEAESIQAVAPKFEGVWGPRPTVLDLFMSGSVKRRLECGRVFVMSDGKTVAKYDLGGLRESSEQDQQARLDELKAQGKIPATLNA